MALSNEKPCPSQRNQPLPGPLEHTTKEGSDVCGKDICPGGNGLVGGSGRNCPEIYRKRPKAGRQRKGKAS